MSKKFTWFLSLVIVCSVFGSLAEGSFDPPTNSLTFKDANGEFSTYTTARQFDSFNPFFQNLGTNGRTCGSCHVASDSWTVTPAQLQQRWQQSNGRDPIFLPVDGTVCPDSDISTPKNARAAFSLLLNKGLIRIQLPVPASAEFSVVSVDDPYHCKFDASNLSVYRRVLPATNLRFLSTYMWDERETFPGYSQSQNLAHQALDATLGHAQASLVPTAQQLQQIVAFEMATYTAQNNVTDAGALDQAGGQGGPVLLSRLPFQTGENPPGGATSTGNVFTLFQNFGTQPAAPNQESPHAAAAQASIRRGEALFNTRSFTIDNVFPATITSTCSGCHNSVNAGTHSAEEALHLGTADAAHRTADLPLYTLFCSTTGVTVQTTDPGRALITGKCSDIGAFRDPVLRNLSARGPYFHNGSAATLNDVVDFYNTRFSIGLSKQEKADLATFLGSL